MINTQRTFFPVLKLLWIQWMIEAIHIMVKMALMRNLKMPMNEKNKVANTMEFYLNSTIYKNPN